MSHARRAKRSQDLNRRYPPQDPAPMKSGSRARCVLPDAWTHVSTRTVNGRYAFLPMDIIFSQLVWGIVAVAQRRYGVDVAAFAMLGNHYHALIRARRTGAVSSFMRYLNAGLVQLTHDYYGTTGRVWAQRFRSTCLLDNEAESYWFKYILSHSVKEEICEDPRLWPGPHCAEALCSGAPIEAYRLDRSAWLGAGRPGNRASYLVPIEMRLTPLSAFESGPAEDYRAWCNEQVQDIIIEHADCHFAGLDKALSQSPLYVPSQLKKSRCYTFDARGELRGELLKDAYTARRAGVEALAELNVLLIRRGHAAISRDGHALPEGFDWTPMIMDAIEDRPIEGPLPRACEEDRRARA